VSFRLHGDANDYTGKGLSGGTLTVLPPDGVTYVAEENVLIGNTVLYGATSGKAFFRGLAGERFAVRNSGASAVIEGVGDHGCEYMTGGRVVVLGSTGRNFAAGMSGGLAFVLDEDGTFPGRVNPAMRDQLEPLDEGDAIEVRSLVAEHAERTGSSVARRVLDEWDELAPRFVKIFPTDYKRVLAERAAAEAAASSNGASSGNGAVSTAKKVV
jgi:glutamate synthase domain-containing protein 3